MSTQPNLGMRVTTFENPMGIDGFGFVEYAAPRSPSRPSARLLPQARLVQVARHARGRSAPTGRATTFLINEDAGLVRRALRRAARPERLRWVSRSVSTSWRNGSACRH